MTAGNTTNRAETLQLPDTYKELMNPAPGEKVAFQLLGHRPLYQGEHLILKDRTQLDDDRNHHDKQKYVLYRGLPRFICEKAF